MDRLCTIFLVACFMTLTLAACRTDTSAPESQWQMADCPIPSRWAEEVDPKQPLPEYPRPMMVREKWLNLNGLWEYALKDAAASPPDTFAGRILVPFAIESALSGVKDTVGPGRRLWYRRSFTPPSEWAGNRLLLHFEAVDWETQVWIDGEFLGAHQGGYDPFTFDITDKVSFGAPYELLVAVWDPTDTGSQPRGKQVNDPGGIFYTSVTGIWQTVWLEAVPETYIADFRIVPDVQASTCDLRVQVENMEEGDMVEAVVLRDSQAIQSMQFNGQGTLTMNIPDAQLWSPDDPFLYDLSIRVLRDGEEIDRVESYFGMREVSLGTDDAGITRIMLNGKYLFQNGPLDQGYWPDGLYTAPTDEALRYDLEMTKEMGFNMLRKHVKIENRRFYTWCDRLGLLVWQDMPSGDRYISPNEPDIKRNPPSARQFERELTRMIQTKLNHPSIIMWVPFNEGWGQYHTAGIVKLIKELDDTRLVNNASGWADRGVGDIYDLHHYPEPIPVRPETRRAAVLGEFGGLGFAMPGHTWVDDNWGYQRMGDTTELINTLEEYYAQIARYERRPGLSAVVYTQTTDVETETNGLMTYDRERTKVAPASLRQAMEGYAPPLLPGDERRFLEVYRVELISPRPGADIYYTTDGTDPDTLSIRYTQIFPIRESTTLKARAYWPNGRTSRVNTIELVQVDYHTGVSLTGPQRGLRLQHFEGEFPGVEDLLAAESVNQSIDATFDLAAIGRQSNYGLVWTGYIDIRQRGGYTFFVESDDGTQLWIGDELIVDNDGSHGPRERSGICALEPGYHPFKLAFFQGVGGQFLQVYWAGPTFGKRAIPPARLVHVQEVK